MSLEEIHDDGQVDAKTKITFAEDFCCPSCGSGGPNYSDVTIDGGNCAHCGVGLETLEAMSREIGIEVLKKSIFIISESDAFESASELATSFRELGFNVINSQNLLQNGKHGADSTNMTSLIRNTAVTLIIPSEHMDMTSTGRFSVRKSKHTDFEDRIIPVYTTPAAFQSRPDDLYYFASCNWTGTSETAGVESLVFDKPRLFQIVGELVHNAEN